MRKLWISVMILGLVYLSVWGVTTAGDKQDKPNATRNGQAPASAPSRSPKPLEILREKAAGDARGRTDSASTLHADTVRPAVLTADLTQQAKKDTPGAVEGFVIVVTSKIDDKPRSKITYHAAAPDRLVYVSTEVIR